MYQRHASVRNNAFHSTYLADRVGRAAITPTGEFEAGSFASITLTYTAGYFGIDDTGSLKIVQRFASDAGRPQFNDRSEEHTSELQSRLHLVCRLLLEKKNKSVSSACTAIRP